MSKKIQNFLPDTQIINAIRFLILDVDGVMTDGKIIYDSTGADLKVFDVKDGAGLKYWARAGHAAGIISGRSSVTIGRRAAELDIAYVETDAKDKLPVFRKMLAAAGVKPEETAVIGDDLMDLPLIVRAGLGIAVADAVPEVRDAAAFVTQKRGGDGAVREAVETILKIQGRWDGILARYIGADESSVSG